jgi:hypothetical protein
VRGEYALGLCNKDLARPKMIPIAAILFAFDAPDKDQIRRALEAQFDRHSTCRVAVVVEQVGDPPILKNRQDIAVVKSAARWRMLETNLTTYRDPSRKPRRTLDVETYFDENRFWMAHCEPGGKGVAESMSAKLDGLSDQDRRGVVASIPRLAFGGLPGGPTLSQTLDAAREVANISRGGKILIRVVADHRLGHIEMILDPSADFLPLEIVHTQSAKTLTESGKAVGDHIHFRNRHARATEFIRTCSDVRTSRRQGRSVILGYQYRSVGRYSDGQEYVIEERYELKNWEFPSSIPESEFRFERTIPDGLNVHVDDRPTILHEWRNGEIVKLLPIAAVNSLQQLQGYEIRPGDATAYYWTAAAFALALVGLLVWRWRWGA